MTREQMISRLVEEDVDMVTQWVTQGCYEELFSYVSSLTGYEDLDDDTIVAQYQNRVEIR